MSKKLVFIIMVLVLGAACQPQNQQPQRTTMTIASPAFAAGANIPAKYTCDGESLNPPLRFSSVPSQAKSLALVMDDPDVPKALKPDGIFDHWVAWNIPPATAEIPEGQAAPGVTGANGAGKNAYTGPCPPDREHRYFFKLYALDTTLDLPTSASKPELEQAMAGHILQQAELQGRYDRQR